MCSSVSFDNRFELTDESVGREGPGSLRLTEKKCQHDLTVGGTGDTLVVHLLCGEEGQDGWFSCEPSRAPRDLGRQRGEGRREESSGGKENGTERPVVRDVLTVRILGPWSLRRPTFI